MTSEAQAQAQVEAGFDTAKGGNGEASVQAGMTLMCSAAASQYGGAYWCGPAVAAAWKYLKPAMVWCGEAFSDALAAMIPEGLRAKGAYPWFQQIETQGNAVLRTIWQDAVRGIEIAWETSAELAAVQVPKVDANQFLLLRLFAEGKPSVQYDVVEHPYTDCQYRGTNQAPLCVSQTRRELVWRPTAKPWDKMPIVSGLDKSWVQLGHDRQFSIQWNPGSVGNPNAAWWYRITAMGGDDVWPDQPNKSQVMFAELAVARAVQNSLIRPLQVQAALAIGQASADIARLRHEAKAVSAFAKAGLPHGLVQVTPTRTSSASPVVPILVAGVAAYGGWLAYKRLWR